MCFNFLFCLIDWYCYCYCRCDRRIKVFTIAAVIKKLKSVIQKGRKKQQNNILTKTKLITIEVLVSQTFMTK